MNKIIASTAFAFAVALSGAAFAAPTDTNNNTTPTGIAAQVANLGPKTGNTNFGNLLNNNTGLVNGGNKVVTFPNSLINYNGFVNIKSTNGAMIPPGHPLAAVPGFAGVVNYVATATFDTANLAYTTSGTIVNINGTDQDNQPVGPALGTVTLTLTIPAGPAAPNPSPIQAAASYTDIVIVGLGATI